MNWIKRHSRLVAIGIGCLLLCGGIFVAYWWFYKLAPMRHLADPNWRGAHSAQARWEEEKEKYRRLSASPDLCFAGDMIGYYGNKTWCLWLIDKMYGSENFRVCGCTETALMFMANRNEQSWKDWATKHRNETQEEWIRDGFAQHHVTVHLPPQPDDELPLLEILGQKTWTTLWGGPKGTNAPDAFPDYLQYNAFRWLRDSGFNQTAFVISNSTAFTSDVVRVGLMQYTKWNEAYPRHNGVGILVFDKDNRKDKDVRFLPTMLQPWFLATVYSFIVFAIVGGCFLLLWKRKKSVPPIQRPSENHADTLSGPVNQNTTRQTHPTGNIE